MARRKMSMMGSSKYEFCSNPNQLDEDVAENRRKHKQKRKNAERLVFEFMGQDLWFEDNLSMILSVIRDYRNGELITTKDGFVTPDKE